MPYHQWPYFSTACFPLQKLNILMKRKLGNTGKQMITFHQTDQFLHSVCCLQKPPLPLCPCVCVCVCDRFKCVSNHQVHIFLSGLDFYYKSHVCWKKNLTVIETQKLKTAALHTAKLQHLLLISTKKTNVHPPQQVAPVCKVLLVPPSSRGQS